MKVQLLSYSLAAALAASSGFALARRHQDLRRVREHHAVGVGEEEVE